MNINPFVALFLPLTALSASLALAAPYSTTYSGTYGSGSLLESNPGSLPDTGTFTVTLVIDNGAASPASQIWNTTDLDCIIWSFNGGEAVFANDLSTDPPQTATGTMSTDANGTITSIFDEVSDRAASAYTSEGFASPLIDSVFYFANDSNGIFYDGADTSTSPATEIEATDYQGVEMNPARWSSATPYSGDCVARAQMQSESATPVPTLQLLPLGLLAGLLGMLGVRRLKA